MKTLDRLKMCPNCDGRIAQDASQCPYCFTILQVETQKTTTPPQESLVYSSSYKQTEAPKLYPEKEEIPPTTFWPTLCMLAGGNLLTLGLLQFIFSDHGRIRLEINGSYWFLMLLAALPLFYFGLKNLKK